MRKRIPWLGATAVAAIMLASCLLTLLFRPPAPAAGLLAGVRYVRPDGSDAGNVCLAPGTPCATIQRAVDVAAAGDEVWVAGGTYAGVQARQGISQVLYISQSVTIQGGYTAVFDSPPDPQANPTILDAAGQGRVIYVAPAQIVSLAGLQLVNGRAALANGSSFGGGLYSANAELSLTGMVLAHNQAAFGGGLYVYGGRLSLQNSALTNNQAGQGGGGARLFNIGPDAALLAGNTFSGNMAALFGGGLYLSQSQAVLAGNHFLHNTATVATQGHGGGLNLSGSSVTLDHNVVEGNEALFGGGLWLQNTAATLSGNAINSNQADYGGGIYFDLGSSAIQIRLDNNVLAQNSSVMQVTGEQADLLLRHNTVRGNGGGIEVHAGRVEMVNSLMADQPAGIVNQGGAVTLTATLWDDVAQPWQGSVSHSGSLTGTAAFAADGVHLTAVSAAIDSGVDAGLTTDLDGLSRPAGSGFDLGAVEWRPLAALKTVWPGTAAHGALVTYTIVLTAPEPPGMTAWLTDDLPAGVSFVGPLTVTAGSGGYSGGVITWTGQMTPGTAVVLRWPAQLAPDLPPATSIFNTAVIRTPAQTLSSTTAVVVIPDTIFLPLLRRGHTFP